jgi:hypothetical protein
VRNVPQPILPPSDDVRSVPDGDLGAALIAHWTKVLASEYGADDQMMVFGTKVRARDPALVYAAVETFLNGGDESARAEVVGWFLAGFLTPGSEPPASLLDQLVQRLGTLLSDPPKRDPVLFVLASALRTRLPPELRERIRQALRDVTGNAAIPPPDEWVATEIAGALRDAR